MPARHLIWLCLVAGLHPVFTEAVAAASPEEASRLGTELTPLGAERAGNADGSIPPWDPAMTPIPEDYEPGSNNYINPFPNEKPLCTIDAGNWQDHAQQLTEGSKAMLEKLGHDGFMLRVYPSKRSHSAPDWFYANTLKNAVNAKLVAGGQKIENSLPGTPFPIPQSALEVLWNHMIRYAEPSTQDYDVYYVNSNGKPILSTTATSALVYPMYETPDEPVGDKAWLKLRINYKAPARRAGEILLVHEPGADYSAGQGRRAWQYLTGQRRVRLAPAVAFDTPNPAVAGTSTYDDAFIFNGSPERFDWKLLGKREMIVPYSNYDFIFKHEVENMLGERFLKPEFVRWEKHRVWVIEATLKPGQRHLYGKRRLYIDEDSWSAVAGETYDARGNLWRVQFNYSARLYDGHASAGANGVYDLLQDIYNLNGKPKPGKYRHGFDSSGQYFTPKGMARAGVR
ncbi:DUF1329 domain-containing protein [Pseudohalioglobus lutimaris]|nr:DUF1329 domain-containing protein [Pseudohalioglobus lutimaris]